MRGLILAAGRGRRMGGETEARPKGMVELRGRPLIGWQLDALRAAGVHPVAIVRGYRGECLPFDVPMFDNPRWAETNMVSSLACAEEWLRQGPTIVSYADLVYPPEAPATLAADPGDLAITCDPGWLTLWQQRFDDPLSDAETLRIDDHGHVVDIGRRPERLDEVEAQYMGLLKLTARGAERLLARHRALPPAERDRIDLTTLLRRSIAEGETLHAVRYDGWWCEVDSPSDLRVAERVVPV
jgi:choline kinase